MDRDLNITDKTPIAALTVGEFKILFEQLYVEITNKYEINKVNELFGKEDCSKFTGFSVNTLNKFICERKIPHYKRGAKVIFNRKEIEQWLLSNKVDNEK